MHACKFSEQHTTLNPEKARKELFKQLDDYLRVSHKKFMCNNIKAKERRSWARIGILSIQTYVKLLEVHELEQMTRDIEAIKKKVGLN